MGEQATRGLAKKLGTLDVWVLGVGIVVCGQYFGWNLGLEGNGPVAMLLASLFVCVLFVAWLLTLPELSVAMPYADGPLEYGRQAWGRALASAWPGRCSSPASSGRSRRPSRPATTSPSWSIRLRPTPPWSCGPGWGPSSSWSS